MDARSRGNTKVRGYDIFIVLVWDLRLILFYIWHVLIAEILRE
jgi:hypothetical protein